MIELREAAHRSAAYEATVALRRAALRVPLGLDFSPEELDREGPPSRHLALVDGSETVACAIIVLQSLPVAVLRQVAVADGRRGRGLGSAVVRFAESIAAEAGASEVHLHARLEVRGFYERLGYSVSGPTFMEIGIPHVAMHRAIIPPVA